VIVQLSSLRAAPSALPSVREQLFTEIVVRTIDQVGEPFYERVVELEQTDDLGGSLLGLARALVRVAGEP
jgi:phage terminase Nu1 subunit (DNA packaging protein)